jgi:hypothetical protein
MYSCLASNVKTIELLLSKQDINFNQKDSINRFTVIDFVKELKDQKNNRFI